VEHEGRKRACLCVWLHRRSGDMVYKREQRRGRANGDAMMARSPSAMEAAADKVERSEWSGVVSWRRLLDDPFRDASRGKGPYKEAHSRREKGSSAAQAQRSRKAKRRLLLPLPLLAPLPGPNHGRLLLRVTGIAGRASAPNVHHSHRTLDVTALGFIMRK
jgi:hypothetical protein